MGTRESDRKWYYENREEILARRRARASERRAEKSAADRAYYLANKNAVADRNQRWAEKNRQHSNEIKKRHAEHHPYSVTAARKKWIDANQPKLNAKEARRRAVKHSASPTWGDQEAITRFYDGCPPGFEVDHVVPLRGLMPCGARVTGLHVIGNLRYLPAKENRSRRNRMSQAEVEEMCCDG